ncbi:helix-turn-helix domain-containing protein [Selenomonadales bacterium OttesenSCG-928-I06]|nr:helix-turn-helix domain-containing protein [Selenomonadales bacterium OttesenSCG-928-I06]
MRPLLIKFRGEVSQEAMAKHFNVTQQTWSNWEKGTSTPPPHVMKQIEIESGYLMEEIFFDVFNKSIL